MVKMNKSRIFFNRKDFRKLNKQLYILPELLPDREIKKYINIWVDAYNIDVPTNAIMKSNFNVKEFLNIEIPTKKKKRRK